MSIYRVAKKYTKGPEQEIADFNNVNDAKAFIRKKLQEDASLRMNTSYHLYDAIELIESFDQSNLSTLGTTDSSGDDSSGGGGKSGSHQRPSPLQTSLRPGGLPPSAPKSDDKKD